MTSLPVGWAWTTLEDLLAVGKRAITDGPFGSKLASRHYVASGARVIRLQNIGDGYFRNEEAYISEEYFEELRAHEAGAGDLLIASLGEELPRACIAPDLGVPAIVKADCIRARIHPEIDTRWVLYALMALPTRTWATSRIRGVGRPRLGMAGIRQIPVPVPPSAEQRRIVAVVESHLSSLGNAREVLSKALTLARKLHQSVLDDAIDHLGRVPTRSLGSILREPLRNGHSARTSEDKSGIRTLTLSAVTNNEFSDRYTKMKVVDPSRVVDLWLEPGDILIQRSNTPELVGTSALYRGAQDWAIFPDLLIRARVAADEFLPAFVQLILSGSRARSYMKSSARGLAGSMPKIDQAVVENVGVPVISRCRQEEVVDMVQFLQADVARMISSVRAALSRQSNLRRAILNEAFVGRLVEQDPTDEPAGMLLQRIRAERAAHGSAPQMRRGLGDNAHRRESLL
jgi:type I restriction enzyme, S subunit